MTQTIPTGRARKILEALFAISPDGPKLVPYEDIVVKAWEMYPDDFGLRGYSDRYPDSSDLHVPLYKELKSNGYVSSGPVRQKKFKLTPAGWELARTLLHGDERVVEMGRLSRTAGEEIGHMERSTAFRLYLAHNQAEILDTDFYAFYRTSVRSGPRDFAGRLVQSQKAIDEALDTGHPNGKPLHDLDSLLRTMFAEIIRVKRRTNGEAR